MNVSMIPLVGPVSPEQVVVGGDSPSGEIDFMAILQAAVAGVGDKGALSGSPVYSGEAPIAGAMGTGLPGEAGEAAPAAGGTDGEPGDPAKGRTVVYAANPLLVPALAGQMIQVVGSQAAVSGEADAPAPDIRGDVQVQQPAAVNLPPGLTRVPPPGEPPGRQPVDEKLPPGLRRVLPPGEPPAAVGVPVGHRLNGTAAKQQPVDVKLPPGLARVAPPGELPAVNDGPVRLALNGTDASQQPVDVRLPPGVAPVEPRSEPPAAGGLPVGLRLTGRVVSLPVEEPASGERQDPTTVMVTTNGGDQLPETDSTPGEGLSRAEQITPGGSSPEEKPVAPRETSSGPRQEHPAVPAGARSDSFRKLEPSRPPAEPPTAAVTNLTEVRNRGEEPFPRVPPEGPVERDGAVQLMRQVADRARWFRGPEEVELQFRLKPDHLGQVHVRLAFSEGGRLHAHFRVENLPAQEALKAGFPELREALQEQGIRLDGFNVDLGREGFQGFQSRGERAAFTGGAGARWVARYEEAEDVASPASIRGLPGMGSRVDYLI